jgi:hypothetical protein
MKTAHVTLIYTAFIYFSYMCYFIYNLLIAIYELLISFFLFCGKIEKIHVKGVDYKVGFTAIEANILNESIDFYTNILSLMEIR